MAQLFKTLRIHQVFGANTDVGKTLLTTALVRASAAREKNVFYLKPVSTGPMEDADDEYVMRFTGDVKKRIQTKCLFRYDDPVSPHLAALRAQGTKAETVIPSDNTIVNAVASYVRQCAQRTKLSAHMYVETAGGVHSPTLSGSAQLDAYRPLFLPTVLIGDSKLGGISTTVSAYESLLLRGYIVDAVILFRDEYYRNFEYLERYFGERGVKLFSFGAPPAKHADPNTNFELTNEWYEEVTRSGDSNGSMLDVVDYLDTCHTKRIEELDSMPRRTMDNIWWPFVQHGLVKEEKDINVIDSASGDVFSVYNAKRDITSSSKPTSVLEPQFDGSASWWTQALGHAHPSLTIAAARAAGRYGHVMFPEATHLPALKLAERLVKDGPGKGWASRAFFSDDGSTGMEVALKMALRAFAIRHGNQGKERVKRRDLGIVGLKGSYHGDTIGAMDACEEGIYTCEWHEAKGYWFDPPTISIKNGSVYVTLPQAIAAQTRDQDANMHLGSLEGAYDVEKRLKDSTLSEVYQRYIERTLMRVQEASLHTLAALVLEPVVMGAGGMLFVDPLFQRILVDVVRGPSATSSEWSGMPVIFDEVFVGLYRLGHKSTTSILGVNPDISVHAKILTGGLVPLAVTMASESIFKSFYGDQKADALLHGHSYTAYPVGCEVANATLDILDKMVVDDAWAEAKKKWRTEGGRSDPLVWSLWDPAFVGAISKLKTVGETMAMGTVLSIKVADDSQGYQSHSAQRLLQAIKEAVPSDEPSPVPGGAPYSMHYRTLGNVAYFMLSLNTPSDTIRSVEHRIWDALHTPGEYIDTEPTQSSTSSGCCGGSGHGQLNLKPLRVTSNSE